MKFSDMKQEMDKQKKLAQGLQKDLDISEEKAKVKKF